MHDHGSATIVTAAHCLPMVEVEGGRHVLTLPAHRWSDTTEHTFKDLVSPLGREPTIWSECLFADPVADVALLCAPDGQSLFNEYDQFNEFADSIPPLEFSSQVPSSVWVLSLSGKWREVRGIGVTHHSLFAESEIKGGGGFNLEGGMSGSPILDSAGKVVGVVSVEDSCPRLPHTLPKWFAT